MVLLACTSAGIQITIVLLAFTVFSFLPNRSALPRNFWQQISHTVGCIPANKASIASCLSRTLTVFYSSAWNAQYEIAQYPNQYFNDCLPNNTSPGPDDISSLLTKGTTSAISILSSLSLLFNLSLTNGSFPVLGKP